MVCTVYSIQMKYIYDILQILHPWNVWVKGPDSQWIYINFRIVEKSEFILVFIK